MAGGGKGENAHASCSDRASPCALGSACGGPTSCHGSKSGDRWIWKRKPRRRSFRECGRDFSRAMLGTLAGATASGLVGPVASGIWHVGAGRHEVGASVSETVPASDVCDRIPMARGFRVPRHVRGFRACGIPPPRHLRGFRTAQAGMTPARSQTSAW